MVLGNTVLDMSLFDSSSSSSSSDEDDLEMLTILAFLRQLIMLAFLEQKRHDRLKRHRIRRRQSRSLPMPFIPSNPEFPPNNDNDMEVGEYDESLSFSSGYEREDSSADEVDGNSSGSLTKDDDIKVKDDVQGDANVVNTLSDAVSEEICIPSDVGCILKCKSGFKCRLCPRIVCMTEEALKAHLKSKRHACSEILLTKGRLRLIGNSDGEVEGEVNAGAERRARIAAAAMVPANSWKEKEVRLKRRNRLKKKKGEDTNLDKASLSAKHPAKKRLKLED